MLPGPGTYSKPPWYQRLRIVTARLEQQFFSFNKNRFDTSCDQQKGDMCSKNSCSGLEVVPLASHYLNYQSFHFHLSCPSVLFLIHMGPLRGWQLLWVQDVALPRSRATPSSRGRFGPPAVIHKETWWPRFAVFTSGWQTLSAKHHMYPNLKSRYWAIASHTKPFT
jgi:hypothetical protein